MHAPLTARVLFVSTLIVVAQWSAIADQANPWLLLATLVPPAFLAAHALFTTPARIIRQERNRHRP
ncbi:hypothetical protein [Actinokineospora inagensis]|uniref:hypothetical protein n=1 Tax=Actinokineospora inagensis TaxID=103730 RepID=UPI00040E99E2|nr:hypothetical protein [Actinokineospora inagensis]